MKPASTQLQRETRREGFALLITLLIMGILLAISGSLMHVTLKQFQISGIALASEKAFHAANAGIECAQFHDLWTSSSGGPLLDRYRVGLSQYAAGTLTLTCLGGVAPATVQYSNAGNTTIESGERQEYWYSWGGTYTISGGSPKSITWTGTRDKCTIVHVYKFTSAVGAGDQPMNVNGSGVTGSCREGATCTLIKSRGYNTSCATISTNPRAVERELILRY